MAVLWKMVIRLGHNFARLMTSSGLDSGKFVTWIDDKKQI